MYIVYLHICEQKITFNSVGHVLWNKENRSTWRKLPTYSCHLKALSHDVDIVVSSTPLSCVGIYLTTQVSEH